MATPLSSNFTRLTSADLLKFKHYLVENVSRSMEGEMPQFGDQGETIKQRLNETYVQTKVSSLKISARRSLTRSLMR